MRIEIDVVGLDRTRQTFVDRLPRIGEYLFLESGSNWPTEFLFCIVLFVVQVGGSPTYGGRPRVVVRELTEDELTVYRNATKGKR